MRPILRDLAVVQRYSAQQLDVEVPHLQHAAACLANRCECLGKQVIQRLAVSRALAISLGPGAQLRVREFLHLGL
jgi:hypothetical protein